MHVHSNISNNHVCLFSVHLHPCLLVHPEFSFWRRPIPQVIATQTFQRHDMPFYLWNFRTHSNFRSNLTFNFIYFSALPDCSFAKLIVLDCDFVQTLRRVDSKRFIWKQVQVATAEFQHKFCGTYSKTIVFPRCKNAAVKTTMHFFVTHHTELFYSVIDHSKIFSVPIEAETDRKSTKSGIQCDLILAVLFIQSLASLQGFKLTTHKYETFLVRASLDGNLPVEIYDGPGTLSPVMRTDSHSEGKSVTFHTSSFQCIVFVYNHSVSLRYAVVNNTNKSTKMECYGSPIHFAYPNIPICGKNTICLLFIETNFGFKVHLSSSHAQYRGEYNTDYCSFAGVSAHDSGNEISSFCPKQSQSIEGSDYTFPTIYSSGYTLLIVFYSYKEYGTMNVNLTISRTLCQAIQINVCKLVYSNPLLGLFHTKLGQYTFYVNETDCLILQLSYNAHIGMGFVTDRCEVDFRAEMPTDKTKIIKLAASVFFQGL